MHSRTRAGILFGAFLIAVTATVASTTPTRQWMTVNFQRPTLVAGVIISGPALIVHDDAKMQKGEACTTVYRFDRVKGPQQELVSFMRRGSCFGTTEN